MAAFSEILSELRKDRHLTQKELADAMNVSIGTISNYETGRHLPDLDTLVWLADNFDVTTDYLLGRTENKLSINRIEEPFTAEVTVGALIDTLLALQEETRELLVNLLNLIRIGDFVGARNMNPRKDGKTNASNNHSDNRR